MFDEVMHNGKKHLPERIVSNSLAIVGEKIPARTRIETLEAAIGTDDPQLPRDSTPAPSSRATLSGADQGPRPAARPIWRFAGSLSCTRDRREYSMADGLAAEILDATRRPS